MHVTKLKNIAAVHEHSCQNRCPVWANRPARPTAPLGRSAGLISGSSSVLSDIDMVDLNFGGRNEI